MITLDGSTLEGGGQLVRVALSLSAIHRIPIRIERVRANRSNHNSKRGTLSGGLKESHLAALTWLADACHAKVDNAHIGSERFTFRPSPALPFVIPQHSTITLTKPGSIFLVIQALLPFLVIHNPHNTLTITLHGGTNVPSSMSGDYVQHVLLPTLSLIFFPHISLNIHSRGWASHPSSIGSATLTIHNHNPDSNPPFVLKPFSLATRGEITHFSLHILAPTPSLLHQLHATIVALLHNHFPSLPLKLTTSDLSGAPTRTYVLLIAHISTSHVLGRDVLYERTIRNAAQEEVVARKVAEEIVGKVVWEIERGAVVDEWMEDQLVVWQALVEGEGRGGVEVGLGQVVEKGKGKGEERRSLHARTVRWVCGEVLGEGMLTKLECGSW